MQIYVQVRWQILGAPLDRSNTRISLKFEYNSVTYMRALDLSQFPNISGWVSKLGWLVNIVIDLTLYVYMFVR